MTRCSGPERRQWPDLFGLSQSKADAMKTFVSTMQTIQDDIDNGRMFGASIIVARGGKIGLQKVFGTVTPDGRAACDDDIYLAMSVSKSFTATLVLRSIDQGRFTLDTKVVEILPDFAAGGKQNVTLRQLLNHTAGTFRGFLPPGISAENLGNLDQYYASVASMPIDYAVLGKILVATDPKERNFRTIAKEELFNPLSMEHSCFGLAEDHANRVPVCHTEKQTNASTPMTQNMLIKGCTNGNEMPAASAFCTIHDLFRFVETMRQRGTNGEYRLMSKALFDYACRNHTGSLSNGALVPEKEARNMPDSPALYSLLEGYVRGEGHFLTGAGYTASPRAFYAIGGGSTMWMVDPDRDLSVCFLSAGFIEGLHHLERLSKINDLALAACD
ncbi:hypothetical protein CDV36_007849 [Fusarium kuroshium]|uniref:Beta-lactamase-related domain-containing protein n=1 Tax=Fusarium kuroshium TaxID=2010991 RepID=A0A3M2S4N6_9HYPO|nr:hypothetical protein CDV36_007849 [Fusarium kuroshium]